MSSASPPVLSPASTKHIVRETTDAQVVEEDDDTKTLNQYRLLRVLGQGAYGIVHLAIDTRSGDLKTEYAVKEFSKSKLRRLALQRSRSSQFNSPRTTMSALPTASAAMAAAASPLHNIIPGPSDAAAAGAAALPRPPPALFNLAAVRPSPPPPMLFRVGSPAASQSPSLSVGPSSGSGVGPPQQPPPPPRPPMLFNVGSNSNSNSPNTPPPPPLLFNRSGGGPPVGRVGGGPFAHPSPPPMNLFGRAMQLRKQQQQQSAEPEDPFDLIRTEVAVMKKLDHPHIVRLVEVLDDPENDSLYMVLEMCHKGSIMEINAGEQSDTRFSEDECRALFRPMFLGIEYLHANGIIHHDIKPDNLLRTKDGVLKYADFGTSEMFSSETSGSVHESTGTPQGTPAFMPPEMFRPVSATSFDGDSDAEEVGVLTSGQSATSSVGSVGSATRKSTFRSACAVDVWALGVTLYCLAFGKLPFDGTNIHDITEAILNSELSFPASVPVSAEFRHLLERMLDKNPRTRITVSKIRDVPWLTNDGKEQPLPSKSENCANLITEITDDDIKRAFSPVNVLRGLIRSKIALGAFKRKVLGSGSSNSSSSGGGGGSAEGETMGTRLLAAMSTLKTQSNPAIEVAVADSTVTVPSSSDTQEFVECESPTED
ncbi:Pkinase-domain-containing protein [Ramicandelaber brevisporus]|nr:Pkinase-domain-containing protein [Ramicandelaber brevisporus]